MKKIFAEDQDLRAEMLDWLVKNWKTFKEVQSESYEDICQYALVGMEKYCASSSNDLIQHSYEECLAELQSCSFVILLAEYSQSSGSSENDFFLKVLKYLNSIIEKASTHLYLSKEKVHKAVSLLNHLVSMSSSKSDKSNATLYNIYFQLLRSLQAYILMQFPSRSTNLEDANLCLTSWENLFYILLKLNPSCQWPKQLLAQFEPLVSAAKNMYLSMKKGQKDFLNLKIVLMALKCLRWICCLQQKASLSFNNSMSSYLVEYLGSLDLESSLLCQVSCKDTDERKLVEDYSVMQWSCVLFAVQIQNANNSELLNIEEAMKIFLNLVDSVTDENLPIYIEAVGSLISKATKSAKDHTELICSILDATWKAINSFTRSPAFWKCYQAFLRAFLQKSILLQPDSSILHENIKTLLLQIVSSSGVRPRLLRDAVDVYINIWTKSNGIRNVEYENMETSNIQTTVNSSGDIPCLETNSITSNIEFLVQCLTFDHVHKKDNLALLNVLELSKNKDSNKSDSRQSSHHVPLATILMLSKLDTNSSTDCDLVYSIMEKLLELDKNISKKKLRYHQNSIQHKVKNKIFQAILLLTPYIDLERKSSAIVSCLVNNLKNEAQISVRCYMEWIIALLIYRFPSNQDLLLSHLKAESQGDCNKTGTANSSAVCSYLISALLYGLCIRSVSPQEEYFLNLVNLCLPWCMTQYFNIRLNAMAVLLRMKIHFNETSRSEILLDKYPSLSSCLLLADISTGNVGKNWNKIKENFLLFDLDPLKDLSFETVYVDIPRLFSIQNHVTREDLFHFAQSYQSSGNFCFKSHISMFNTTDKIRKKSVHWVRQEAKPITNDIVVSPDDRYRKNYGASDSEDNDLMNGLDNVQKKIMPWMDVNEITDNRSEKSINKGLVLVASLIDKPSNLGGLTRTCEIFGAESLVVQSLSCTSDKVYQSLSVTAHKWLPLKEVKPWKLPEYLMQMKKSGYTLIGTEQTAQSVCLSKYRFPVKCVVVLGNEKEGIPIPILKILDVCVQIPQKGIIRSLNVHVSGAITVWEYARQHLQT
uniref:probable methyltransferase TARBP1 isoform X1 n=1 Tax=Styela clava TaxID=7725 RepID=UPI00193A7446|nr:probable methyltransferase TARBP1 isoform X1 [Styela clava]